MGKIIILDENTSNKIAAGEVIERPASVVKELVENSIDAGASSITVEIKNGGIPFLKVTDNGSGMEEDDTEIAFERHSTSKIRSSADLDTISTLGFRGEALASIAAVSHLQLTTRTKTSPYGIYVGIRGGEILEKRQTGCPTGTSFLVQDLFYNTPARYKFLKKDSTEAGYVSDIVERIALGNPHISIRLVSNGSNVIHTPGNNDLLSTIFSIYGKEVAREVNRVDYSENSLKITGYIGKPSIARSNRNHQSVYINGRYIRNKTISSAVDEAYKTQLMKNRYPFFILNLDINTLLVDVNVHPGKLEVRFSNEQDIFRAVYHAVSSALLNRQLVGGTTLGVQKAKAPEKFNFTPKQPKYEQQVIEPAPKPHDTQEVKEQPVNYQTAVESERPEAEEKQPAAAGNTLLENARIIGQAFSTYIIFQYEDTLVLLDQHAAHERILFERLRKKYYTRQPLSQMLISPVHLELTHMEVKLLENEREFFSKFGFIYENFGNNSIILRAVPFAVMEGDVKDIFKEVLDRAAASSAPDHGADVDETLYTIACKAAVKANKKLGEAEIRELLKELGGIENPFTCPHGRPVVINITKHDLEKMFKRIV